MPLAVAVTVRATAVISAQFCAGIPLSLTIKAPGNNIRRDVDADSRVKFQELDKMRRRNVFGGFAVNPSI